ncbi:bifunctional sugar-1-phosphate nucleotidylyltransferase/acetyltransferase [Halopenitus sp. H-Gu1]|uniref:bifunctional sugar-1-phosphate nucleotidylyltransferase/acetyltransferase n=1 Tax=Halopenitus sp. H-Gu1 TaxID=3242697 RepID=UPI00359E2095
MQTVVLAAGEGTRMRPLTADRPKPMLPVAGKPLVAHTVETAIAAGASRIVLVVGYEADAVRTYFEEADADLDVPVTFVTQDRRRGTADAVASAVPALDDGPFAVLNGDALYEVADLRSLFESGPAVGSYRVENPSAYGVLERGERGYLEGVIEKPDDPPSNLINTGAYVFPAETRDRLDVAESDRGELELTDALQRACESVDVDVVPVDRWLDVGRPWELLEANEWKLADLDTRVRGTVHPDATITGDVVIEDGARIKSGVVIDGPAYVSAGATVGPNAYVRGATYLGADTKIGHAVEVKNSVVDDGSSLGHLSYLGDSVLGRNVNFGAGTNVANLRHDGNSVAFTVKGDRVSTGRRKFGVVCGDRVKTGIDTSINAGVRLDTETTTGPGETITRDR